VKSQVLIGSFKSASRKRRSDTNGSGKPDQRSAGLTRKEAEKEEKEGGY